jgi:uncharacterized repeat protein (TIGR01451 family)
MKTQSKINWLHILTILTVAFSLTPLNFKKNIYLFEAVKIHASSGNINPTFQCNSSGELDDYINYLATPTASNINLATPINTDLYLPANLLDSNLFPAPVVSTQSMCIQNTVFGGKIYSTRYGPVNYPSLAWINDQSKYVPDNNFVGVVCFDVYLAGSKFSSDPNYTSNNSGEGTNIVQIKISVGGGNGGCNTGSIINTEADISIFKTSSTGGSSVNNSIGTVYNYNQINYTISLLNNGPAIATGIKITDTMPDRVTPIIQNNSNYTISPNWNCTFVSTILTCTTPSPLLNGASTELIILGQINQV